MLHPHPAGFLERGIANHFTQLAGEMCGITRKSKPFFTAQLDLFSISASARK
jgi:hypothetical protein